MGKIYYLWIKSFLNDFSYLNKHFYSNEFRLSLFVRTNPAFMEHLTKLDARFRYVVPPLSIKSCDFMESRKVSLTFREEGKAKQGATVLRNKQN